MEFLDRYNYPPPTTSSVQSEDDEGDEQVMEDKDPEQGSSMIATPTTSVTDTKRHAGKRMPAKRMKIDPVENAIVSLLQKEGEEDEDKGFFMSLYKD